MKEKDPPSRSTRRRGSRGSRAAGTATRESGEFRSSPEIRTGFIGGRTFRAKAIQYAVVDGLAMFEGDIVLGTAAEVAARTEEFRAQAASQVAFGVAISGAQFRWTTCTIPYTIDSTLPTQARVTDAIAHWQQHTNFRFVARSTEADYVTFRPSSGCSSMVGRQGGQQFVNLGAGCTTGNAIHEIGHVVGLWHEQSREDRDAFVTINWTKIMAGFESNFNQHITDGDDIGAYDYGSIMHYPRDAFSVDGTDTITPVQAGAQIGQRTALSAGDIAAANTLCTAKSVKETHLDKIPKEPLKDIRETAKELVKDVVDTRKELPADKHPIKDPPKDPAKDWKELPKEPLKDHKEPPKDWKEPPKDLKEAPKDWKEVPKDWKEPRKDLKELPKDIKEPFEKTIKDPIRDPKGVKELIKERVKEAAFDPGPKAFDPIGPLGPGTVLQPGPGVGLPFAVISPHQAPGAGDPTMAAALSQLQTQLEAITQQLAQVEEMHAALLAQYEQLATLLQQASGG